MATYRIASTHKTQENADLKQENERLKAKKAVSNQN